MFQAQTSGNEILKTFAEKSQKYFLGQQPTQHNNATITNLLSARATKHSFEFIITTKRKKEEIDLLLFPQIKEREIFFPPDLPIKCKRIFLTFNS